MSNDAILQGTAAESKKYENFQKKSADAILDGNMAKRIVEHEVLRLLKNLN